MASYNAISRLHFKEPSGAPMPAPQPEAAPVKSATVADVRLDATPSPPERQVRGRFRRVARREGLPMSTAPSSRFPSWHRSTPMRPPSWYVGTYVSQPSSQPATAFPSRTPALWFSGIFWSATMAACTLCGCSPV